MNRHGALLLSPIQYEAGTTLWVRNNLSLEATRCRVTWVGPGDPSGVYKVGVEFVDEAPTFWGSVYAEAVSTEAAQ